MNTKTNKTISAFILTGIFLLTTPIHTWAQTASIGTTVTVMDVDRNITIKADPSTIYVFDPTTVFTSVYNTQGNPVAMGENIYLTITNPKGMDVGEYNGIVGNDGKTTFHLPGSLFPISGAYTAVANVNFGSASTTILVQDKPSGGGGGGGGGGFPPTFFPGGEGGYVVDFNAAVSTFVEDNNTELALLNSKDKQTLSFLVDMSGDINTENDKVTEVIDKRGDILTADIKNNPDGSQEKNYVTMNFDQAFTMVFTDSTILNNKTRSSNKFYIDVQKIKNTQYNPNISSSDLSLIRDPFVPVTEYNYAFTTYDQNKRIIHSFYRPVSLYAPLPSSVPESLYHSITFYKVVEGKMIAIPTVIDEQRKLVKGITYSPDTYYLGLKTNMIHYKDVPEESSVMPYTYDMTSSDIVHGYDQTPGFYGPDNCVLRSEMVKMAIGSFDIPHPTGIETLYQDTPTSAWYYPYLLAAVQHGILSADSSQKFYPDSCVSRADAVKIMVLAGHFPYQYYDDGSTVFSDVKTTDSFRPYLSYAKQFGIIFGYPDGTFRPNENLKRSEVTSILWHAILTYSELGKRFTPMWEKTENALSDTTIPSPSHSNTNSAPITGNGQ